MWQSDIALKMYLDIEVRERLDEACRRRTVQREARLRTLIASLRRLQADLATTADCDEARVRATARQQLHETSLAWKGDARDQRAAFGIHLE
jgi:hypothetical protein